MQSGILSNTRYGVFINNSKFITWDGFALHDQGKASSCTRVVDRWKERHWKIEVALPCKGKKDIKRARRVAERLHVYIRNWMNNLQKLTEKEVKIKLVLVPEEVNFRWKKKAIYNKRIPLFLVSWLPEDEELAATRAINIIGHELAHSRVNNTGIDPDLGTTKYDEALGTIMGQCSVVASGRNIIVQPALAGLRETYQSGGRIEDVFKLSGIEAPLSDVDEHSETAQAHVKQYVLATFFMWDRFGEHPEDTSAVLQFCNQLTEHPEMLDTMLDRYEQDRASRLKG